MRTFLLFLYSFGLLILSQHFSTHFHLFYFAPFIVYSIYKYPKMHGLWLALLCGFIIDLMSSHMRLGIYSFNYCLTTLLLYSQKQHFFEDSASTWPMMTTFFSILSTLIQIIILYGLGQKMMISWEIIKIDIVLFPLLDGFYAFLFFQIPSRFIPKAIKKETPLFSLKN